MRNNLIMFAGGPDLLYREIAAALTGEGFNMAAYDDAGELLLAAGQCCPDLIILGEGLLPCSFGVCRQLRYNWDGPVLMLGNLSRGEGWVKAVEAGADLYLVPPISHNEMVARVKAILRRREWSLAGGSSDNGGRT